MPRLLILLMVMLTIQFATIEATDAQSNPENRFRRVARPTFNSGDRGIFFDNIFRDGLKGERPNSFGPLTSPGSQLANETPTGSVDDGALPTAKWSNVIASDIVEDEVKSLKLLIDAGITTPGRFASGGFRDAQQNFGMLATMFGIISEYDGDVRWKKDAPAATTEFARMSANASAGSQAVYQQARQRQRDLQDILSGGGFTPAEQGDPPSDWSEISDRTLLMVRLELAYLERLRPTTGSEKAFLANAEEIRHEAGIIAALSEVLIKDEMPEYDDDDYVQYAIQMRAGALGIVNGVMQQNFELAARGSSEIGKACSLCHETYQ